MFSVLGSPEKRASATLMQILAASPSKVAAARILTDIKMQQQAPRTLFSEQPAPTKSLGKRKISTIQQQPPEAQPPLAEPTPKKARVVTKDPKPTKKTILIEDLINKTTPYSIQEIGQIASSRTNAKRKQIIYIRDLLEEIYKQPEPLKRIHNLVCSLFAHEKSTLLTPALDKICSIEKARWPSGKIPQESQRFALLVPSATEKMHEFLKKYKMSHSPYTDYVNVVIVKQSPDKS